MAAEIREASGVDAELVAGGGGIFQVIRDGRTLYDKKETGRFPKPGEVAALVK